jgi:predicted HD superfamily hydrolase involved in NAD metabolism
MDQRKVVLERLSGRLSEARVAHSLGVEACAVEMAVRFGADRGKASVAGLVHDCAKELTPRQAEELGVETGIFEDKWMKAEPKLWHAPLGAVIAKRDYGVTDPEVLGAIACHTTGKPGMTVLDKIIYLADFIEPERVFYGVEELRACARRDLDVALILAFDSTIRYLLYNSRTIHPQTILARNEAIAARNGKA